KKDQTRDKEIEYRDNADRVEVERGFSLLKRCFGMENIRTKLRETTLTTIALSVIAMNVDNINRNRLRSFFGQLKNRKKSCLVLL
ncbi:transposase, partial [Desemzia sp. FAM 24101]